MAKMDMAVPINDVIKKCKRTLPAKQRSPLFLIYNIYLAV